MRLYEYEAKKLFSDYGIPVPEGDVARSHGEAGKVAEKIGTPVAIKAQVLVGGRGIAGGIKFGEDPEDAERKASEMLNADIKGYKVEALLIEEKLEIERELYLGVTIDGAVGKPVVMVSSEGGVAIEETASRYSEKIISTQVDVFKGLHPYEARRLAKGLGFEGGAIIKASNILWSLYKLYEDYDALIAEINPLVVTKDGSIVAADAVLEIDDSALYKYPQFKDSTLERIQDELEREARKVGLSCVNLDGDIGLICSGAGLGMATMDLIKSGAAEPANFLETGGGITKELMAEALRVVLKKPGLRAVFINIYGGINPIHEGAKGVAEVVREDNVKIPIVAKALGNFQEETWSILESAGVKVVKEIQTDRAVRELFKAISR